MSKKAIYIIVAIAAVNILLAVIGVSFFIYTIFAPDSTNHEPTADSIVPTPGTIASELVPVTLTVPSEFAGDPFDKPRTIFLPAGYSISVFAGNLGKARGIAVLDSQDIFVTTLEKVLLLEDIDNDGVVDRTITIADNQQNAHGIFYYKNDLYVAEETQVTAYRNIKLDGTYTKKEVIIPNLPSGGHFTRTIVIGPDEKIYLSIGSSCNVCEEGDTRRAAIVQYNLDGSGQKIFASGLRNSVGMVFHNEHVLDKPDLWAVDNGRDEIGDDIPAEEINIIKEGKNYGWPYCHSAGKVNPEFPNKADYCTNESEYPAFSMQAHSAPLSIAFPPAIPAWEGFRDEAFISFHGSWNRSVPTGYEIVHLNTLSPIAKTVEFAKGWQDSAGTVWGRPVDIKFDANGRMFVSDDQAGAIYLIVKN